MLNVILSNTEVIEWANDTTYGLACGIFTQNLNRAIRVSNALEAGSAWVRLISCHLLLDLSSFTSLFNVKVNCYNSFELMMPFGGYKQSGIGREMGTEAIEAYTRVKGVHINIGQML